MNHSSRDSTVHPVYVFFYIKLKNKKLTTTLTLSIRLQQDGPFGHRQFLFIRRPRQNQSSLAAAVATGDTAAAVVVSCPSWE